MTRMVNIKSSTEILEYLGVSSIEITLNLSALGRLTGKARKPGMFHESIQFLSGNFVLTANGDAGKFDFP